LVVLPFKKEDRCAGSNFEAINFGEGINNLLSDTIAEVFILRISTEIDEREYGDSVFGHIVNMMLNRVADRLSPTFEGYSGGYSPK
jgi:hypothetical protein